MCVCVCVCDFQHAPINLKKKPHIQSGILFCLSRPAAEVGHWFSGLPALLHSPVPHSQQRAAQFKRQQPGNKINTHHSLADFHSRQGQRSREEKSTDFPLNSASG